MHGYRRLTVGRGTVDDIGTRHLRQATKNQISAADVRIRYFGNPDHKIVVIY